MKTYSVIVREVIYVEIPDIAAHDLPEAEQEALRVYKANEFDMKQHITEVTEIKLIQED